MTKTEGGYKAMKPWNQFYSPAYSTSTSANKGAKPRYNQDTEFEVGIQIGSKKFPENEIRGHSHAF